MGGDARSEPEFTVETSHAPWHRTITQSLRNPVVGTDILGEVCTSGGSIPYGMHVKIKTCMALMAVFDIFHTKVVIFFIGKIVRFDGFDGGM